MKKIEEERKNFGQQQKIIRRKISAVNIKTNDI
jgi:hypothetical protein